MMFGMAGVWVYVLSKDVLKFRDYLSSFESFWVLHFVVMIFLEDFFVSER